MVDRIVKTSCKRGHEMIAKVLSNSVTIFLLVVIFFHVGEVLGARVGLPWVEWSYVARSRRCKHFISN